MAAQLWGKKKKKRPFDLLLQPEVFLSYSSEVPDLFFFKIFFFLKDGFLELSEGIQRINFSDSLFISTLTGSIFFNLISFCQFHRVRPLASKITLWKVPICCLSGIQMWPLGSSCWGTLTAKSHLFPHVYSLQSIQARPGFLEYILSIRPFFSLFHRFFFSATFILVFASTAICRGPPWSVPKHDPAPNSCPEFLFGVLVQSL